MPDSFFDLSVSDIKLLIKGLRTQAVGTVEQPLMTAKLREMEEEQKQLSLLNRYKAVIIRIQFPNRYVLQGTFTPYDTIDTVVGFVRLYLANPDIDFHLCEFIDSQLLSLFQVIIFILRRFNPTENYFNERVAPIRSQLCAVSYFTFWFRR